MKKKMFLAFMAFAALAMTGCSNDDNETEQPNVPEQQSKTAFDDMEYFQTSFINIDSLGNFVSRSIGIPLPVYDQDTTHIYVGVENIEEALDYWKQCLAPDITSTTSANHTYTYTLTDEQGATQGTVSFAPSTESSVVADITTDLPGLKHFKKVTFIENDSWPANFIDGHYQVGDLRTITMNYKIREVWHTSGADVPLNRYIAKTRVQQFVCVREKGRGVNPLYVGITPDLLSPRVDTIRYGLLRSDYCPGEPKAKMIADIIGNDWEYFKSRFAAANGGNLSDDGYYWYDDHTDYFLYNAQSCIKLKDGELDDMDYNWHNPSKHALLKVDWLDD